MKHSTLSVGLASGLAGGLLVVMLGAAQPSNVKESLDKTEKLYLTTIEKRKEQSNLRSDIRPPIVAAATADGFVLVISATGGSFVVNKEGVARRVQLAEGEYTTTPDLWTGSTLSKEDLFVAPPPPEKNP